MKNMLLITSSWNGARSFKMIPITKDCPYNECIYDTTNKVLAVVSKEYKKNFHMMPVLDNTGELIKNDNSYQQERVILDTYYEYFIEDKEEIINFINRTAGNSDAYDYVKLLGN